MARYGCLVIGVVIALAILFVVVFFWSGWLSRPVGPQHSTVGSGGLCPIGHRAERPFNKLRVRGTIE